ncbi:glycosyltransferase [Gluconobacter kondonii]|uniref:glycosyltransferase n=1 Tax=Gluconobacter kondonii TaxID=941463 RepID=UPI00209D6434|nr:glycosyltransferase [Gluconobacter kondonii]MCP1237909.1 glycosyltransferase [Gluconobacter kondonii]
MSILVLESSENDTQNSWNHIDLFWMKETYPEIKEIFRDQVDFDPEEILFLAGKCGYQPNPYFDESYYVQRYIDVRHAINQGEFISGFDHYRKIGYKDRDPHWLFCEEYYLNRYTDVARALVNETVFSNGYDHYIQCGDQEFRSGSWFFDPLEYLKSLADGDVTRPFYHYIQNPKRDFDNLYFDNKWYREIYPEIFSDIKNGKWHSLLHQYLTETDCEKYSPSRFFSEKFYVEANPDLVEPIKSGRFFNGYEHFLLYGIQERRRPHPDIDLERFYHEPYIQKLLFNGRIPNVFIGWCQFDGKVPEVGEILEHAEVQTKFSFEKKCTSLAINAARSKLDFSFKHPDISVIVVLHNNFDMTLSALTALRASYRHEIQLIIADSGSNDETCHIEHYVRGATILRFEGNVAFIRACNTAAQNVRAPYVLFLNNDTEIQLGSIETAIDRFRRDPQVGVIGGKLIRTNGLLQEAGAIIYRDGSVAGYMRGASPDAPEANFVRRVDFCSGAALFTRTELFRKIGGFDEDYIPAYYEETDYCVNVWKSGYNVNYDPSITAIHYEYGSSSAKNGTGYINRNRAVFNSKHSDYLSKKIVKSKQNTNLARSVRNKDSKRILFIEDRVPLKSYGSGFSRSHDIITTMAQMGHEVTVFPVFKPVVSANRLYNAFPDSVEIIWDRDINDLESFFSLRAGLYDTIWICRTQNVRRLVPIIEKISHLMPLAEIIADTEAVSAIREEQYDRLIGIPEDQHPPLTERLRLEFECLLIATKIVAVNDYDASLLKNNGFMNVSVLGHVQIPKPTPKPWDERFDFLFVGAIHDYNSPNYDSVLWLTTVLWPELENVLPENSRLIIAGHLGEGVSLSAFPQRQRIIYLGEVDDLSALYNDARFFISPTRYAAGIPYKIYEAASYGLPIIASNIIMNQTGWKSGKEILAFKSDNSKDLLDLVIKTFEDRVIWSSIRSNLINKFIINYNEDLYSSRIEKILFQGI